MSEATVEKKRLKVARGYCNHDVIIVQNVEATSEKKRLRVTKEHINHQLTHEASIEGKLDILS